MKKAVTVVSAALAILVAVKGEEIRFRKTDNIVMLPEKESYGNFEYRIIKSMTENTLLVVPLCVKNISNVAVAGPMLSRDGGYTWKYWFYESASMLGISNVLFR